MPAVRVILLIWTFWVVASAGFATAQSFSNLRLPAPPADGLLDERSVLGKNEAIKARLVQQIRQIEEEHGYRLFVVLEPMLLGVSAQELASLSYQKWLPEGGGLVVVFESDKQQIGLGHRLDGTGGMIGNQAEIPTYALGDLVNDAFRKASLREEGSGPLIESFLTELCANIDGYFERRNQPHDGSRSLRLALLTVGAMSILALCGMGIGWLLAKADRKQFRRRVFPPVDVPERLGAPYGGGGAANSFGSRES